MDIKKNPIFRRALYCFARIASAINEIVPKDENLILFYDSNNTEVVDNTEAIYNYIKQNDRTERNWSYVHQKTVYLRLSRVL